MKVDNFRNSIIQGNIESSIELLADNSVHLMLTSPPYYGLRNYGVSGQIGLEESLFNYINRLCNVFDKCKRVLRDDGVFFLNIGDSYVSSGKGESFLKPKDKMLVPYRVAMELQKRGWWVRNDIVWHKSSCKPESCRDRFTNNKETIFLLTKNKKYYFDRYATRSRQGRYFQGGNTRCVWNLSTDNFYDAHFAVMPMELAKRLIISGTSEKGCCSNCGSQYKRVIGSIEKEDEKGEFSYTGVSKKSQGESMFVAENPSDLKRRVLKDMKLKKYTAGWEKTCDCDCEITSPSIVFDPFFGSGTTGLVARRLCRDFIGVELNEEYVEMAKNRIEKDMMLFNSVKILNKE